MKHIAERVEKLPDILYSLSGYKDDGPACGLKSDGSPIPVTVQTKTSGEKNSFGTSGLTKCPESLRGTLGERCVDCSYNQ